MKTTLRGRNSTQRGEYSKRRSTPERHVAPNALRYILFNKPYGVLSQFTSEGNSRTLSEFGLPKDVYAVGRLDKDSEGLLLLTNDGKLIKQLLDPEHGHKRTYLVQIEGTPTEDSLARLRKGIQIKDYRTLPAEVELLDTLEIAERDPPIRVRKNIPVSWIRMTLREGKNRQVRHMTAAIGHPTLRLIRLAIGEMTLDGLNTSEWRSLSNAELHALKKINKKG